MALPFVSLFTYFFLTHRYCVIEWQIESVEYTALDGAQFLCFKILPRFHLMLRIVVGERKPSHVSLAPCTEHVSSQTCYVTHIKFKVKHDQGPMILTRFSCPTTILVFSYIIRGNFHKANKINCNVALPSATDRKT